jgi:hypothetical protein
LHADLHRILFQLTIKHSLNLDTAVLDVVAYAWNPSTSGGGRRRISSSRAAWLTWWNPVSKTQKCKKKKKKITYNF